MKPRLKTALILAFFFLGIFALAASTQGDECGATHQ
jgi:hypothetical protein